jgi:hypothetical protein
MAKRTENANAILATGTPRKPLIFETNPFDDERLDDVEFSATRFDASYVPGYSEKIIENELRERDGRPQFPLPRLEWVRVTKKGGQIVSEGDEGMLEWLKLGYRACGVADLESMGFGFPPTAHVGSDGLIRRGDVALFFVGDERAERNRIRQKRINEEFASREPMSGDSGEVYEDKTERKVARGSLRELASTELPSL